jgi:hypothetical protein
MRQNLCNISQYRARTMGTLLLKPKEFLVPISPAITTELIKHHTWHSLNLRHNQRKLGRNRAVRTVTTPEAETVFCPYLNTHSGVLTQTSYVALNTHVPQPLQVWSILGSNEGHFTRQAETILTITPRIAAG